MAKQMIKTLSMLTLLAVVALATTAVSAQSSRRVVANVPFSFIVGDKEMPAGNYGIQPTSIGSGILRITGVQNAQSTVRLTNLLHRFKIGKHHLLPLDMKRLLFSTMNTYFFG